MPGIGDSSDLVVLRSVANVWYVDVPKQARRRCKSIDQAVRHAKQHVYLGPNDETRVREELGKCQIARYAYGFNDVWITPAYEPDAEAKR